MSSGTGFNNGSEGISHLPTGSQSEQAAPPVVKPTRSYRACINCRTHKTKCDLGDVNNPISPPCSRCKRERKECVFGESRRGGRANIEAGLAKRKATSEAPGNFGEAGRASEDDYIMHLPAQAYETRQSQPFIQARLNNDGHPSTVRQAVDRTTLDATDRRFSMMPVYDMEPSYLPMLQQITANGKHPISNALPPQSVLQASQVPNDFPINVDNLDMSFVFSGNNIPRPLPKHQNSTTPVVTAPSVAGPRENSIQNIATGPPFSGLFSSPDAALDAGLQSNSTSVRPGEVVPHGFQSALDHLVSSKPRRLSTSTTDSAKKDKDKESKQEKLALKDTRSFVVNAGMHNESDALQILAMAAETQNPKKRKRDYSASVDSPNVEINEKRDGDREVTGSIGPGKETEDELAEANSSGRFHKPHRRTPSNNMDGGNFTGTSRVTFRESSSSEEELLPTPVPDITQFFLVEQGILDPEQVHSLTRTFFAKHHHYFPLIPPNRIPRDADEMAAFAVREPLLLTAFIIIASKCQTTHSARRIHEQSWNLMKGILAEVNFQGIAPTIGLVEGVLLLAENLPRERIAGNFNNTNDKPKEKMPLLATSSDEQKQVISGAENRQAWMLIGGAIRMAYGLGLDQLARQMDGGTIARHRATIAWTYCYIFDRQISIRTGRAFWSRGPALCFRGYSHVAQASCANLEDKKVY